MDWPFSLVRHRKLLITAAILLLLTGTGLLLLPEIVRRLAVRQLDKVLTTPVSIEDMDLNLFTGRGQVSNLLIGDSKKDPPLLYLSTFAFEFSTLGLLGGKLTVHSVSLSRPELLLERRKEGRFNLTEIAQFSTRESRPPWLSGISMDGPGTRP